MVLLRLRGIILCFKIFHEDLGFFLLKTLDRVFFLLYRLATVPLVAISMPIPVRWTHRLHLRLLYLCLRILRKLFDVTVIILYADEAFILDLFSKICVWIWQVCERCSFAQVKLRNQQFKWSFTLASFFLSRSCYIAFTIILKHRAASGTIRPKVVLLGSWRLSLLLSLDTAIIDWTLLLLLYLGSCRVRFESTLKTALLLDGLRLSFFGNQATSCTRISDRINLYAWVSFTLRVCDSNCFRSLGLRNAPDLLLLLNTCLFLSALTLVPWSVSIFSCVWSTSGWLFLD